MKKDKKGALDTFVFTCLKSNKNSHQHIMFWPCTQLCSFFPHMDNVWPGRKWLHFQLQNEIWETWKLGWITSCKLMTKESFSGGWPVKSITTLNTSNMDSQKAVFCFCVIWELRDNIVWKIEIKCLKSKTGFTFIHLIWSVHQKRLRSPTEPICLLDSIQENSCNAEKTPFEGSQCPCSDATENMDTLILSFLLLNSSFLYTMQKFPGLL